jgi:hypothetical protein
MEDEFEIRGFRDRAQDDTNSLLLRPIDWWAEVDRNYPKQTKKFFCDLAEMSLSWGIQGPESASDKAKPWWAFWHWLKSHNKARVDNPPPRRESEIEQ